MVSKITKSQLQEIEDARYASPELYHEALFEITGITAVPYTGYQYYDAAENYIGDDFDSDTHDLLKMAYIEVIDDE